MDLPLIWAGLIALAVFLYVVLDGFDLGVGILFPFADDARQRDQMIASIAPIWDGNETWLILGGGGLLAVFPLAYSALMPALYLPVVLMLIALIFRGVAFEFRHHGARRGRPFWTAAFFAGSLLAALSQGAILGGFIQGVTIDPVTKAFAGGPFDWATPFSLLTALGVAAGYALLGAGWLVFKTEGPLSDHARRWARLSVLVVAGAMAVVSAATLTVDPQVTARWGVSLSRGIYDLDRFFTLGWLPALAAVCVLGVLFTLKKGPHRRPYLFSVGLFATGYLGLAVSLWPYIVPFGLTPAEAASADNALMLMLVGAIITLPAILAYTGFVYWIFRAKVTPDGAYH